MTMKVLVILNDAPYGSERSYNGLRLAGNLVKRGEGVELTVFLMGDAVACAKVGQQTPQGYYNVERMLKGILNRGRVALCGTCMDARGMTPDEMVPGAARGTLDELTDLALAAGRVLVF